MTNLDAIIGFLVDAIGLRVERLEAELYVSIAGERDEFPLAICIALSSGKWIRVTTASDGESIEIGDAPCAGVEMQNDGRILVEEIVDQFPPLAGFVGKMLQKISLVVQNEYGICVGLSFEFDNGPTVFLVNVGDELEVLKDLPIDGDFILQSIGYRF